MKRGLYRNKVGAELLVEAFVTTIGSYLSLGDTYRAVAENSPFAPMYYIVTEKSMADAGYELVEEAKD